MISKIYYLLTIVFLLFFPFPSLHSPFEGNPHRHSSFVIRHSSFLPLSVITFPLIEVASDSWVCAPQKRSMCKGGGLSSFSSLSPFGGSGAYRINDSLHSPFPSLHSPSPSERAGVRILFLSPRNPVFGIFGIVVLYYESIIYTPFLYQSFIIRSSFLYPFYILTPSQKPLTFYLLPQFPLPFFSDIFRTPQPSTFSHFQIFSFTNFSPPVRLAPSFSHLLITAGSSLLLPLLVLYTCFGWC